MIDFIKSFFGDKTLGAKRSSKWYIIRQEHKKKHPYCAFGHKTVRVFVHHIFPFWKYPEYELVAWNLITLCWWHHFWVAHFGSWKSFNVDILKDVARVKNRP